MKKLFAIVIVAFVSLTAFSQVKFGLKAGASTTSLSMPTIKTITSGTTSFTVEGLSEAKYGFHAGVFVRLTLFVIYVQPEILFTTRTNEYIVTQTSVETVVKQNFNKIDIPVMVGLKLGPLRVNAGPAASFLINSPNDLINHPDFESRYSNMTVGYQAGLGVDILRFLTFDLRYEGSLKKYQNQIENLAGTRFNLDDRPNAFLISVGVMF